LARLLLAPWRPCAFALTPNPLLLLLLLLSFVSLYSRNLQVYIDGSYKRRVASVGNKASGRHVLSRVAAALA